MWIISLRRYCGNFYFSTEELVNQCCVDCVVSFNVVVSYYWKKSILAMDSFVTPKAKRPRKSLKLSSPKDSTPVKIPASPFMQKLGWGTAVSVYRMERSPRVGCTRSPWAIKRVMHRKSLPGKNGEKPRRSMNNEISERLCKEADILRSLKHPNVVGFRAFTKSPDGRVALAMEDGHRSLLSLIEERWDQVHGILSYEGSPEVPKCEYPFPPWVVLRVAHGICSALSYLHNEALLLHGDLKSDNILVIGDFDTVKVCDFGVALKVNKKGEILDSEVYIGTRHWLPPEVLELEYLEMDWEEGDDPLPKITTQADMYSFGLTVWEMLSLKFPHCPSNDDGEVNSRGEEDEELEPGSDDETNDLLGTRPPFPPECLEDKSYNPILEIIHCCTDENPDMRPTASQALEWLTSIEESGAMKKPVKNQENLPS
ncbi:hypothetical protein J437_LFUL018693, partial [Ladona fulva]